MDNFVLSFTYDPEKEQGSYKFTPELDQGNFGTHYANLLNGFLNSAISLLSAVSVLRPATKEEREYHIYVFKTDDKEDDEHKLYNLRKQLYEALNTIMDVVVKTSFPDVTYIEDCFKYQQEYAFDEEKDHQGNLEDIQMITENVRAHYDELVAEDTSSTEE